MAEEARLATSDNHERRAVRGLVIALLIAASIGIGGYAALIGLVAHQTKTKAPPSARELGRIESLIREGRWSEAMPPLSAWIADQRASFESTAHLTRPMALWAEGIMREDDAPAAIEAFEALAPDDSTAIGPRRRLVALYTIEARTDDARRVLWDLYRAGGDLRDLLTITTQAVVASDNRDVEPILARYLAKRPDDPWLRRARGLMNQRLGKVAEAVADLRLAADRIENDPVGRIALVDALLGLGETAGLREALGPEPAADRPRDRAAWRVTGARIAEAEGHPEAGLADLREAVAIDGASQVARYRLGQAIKRLGPSVADEARSTLEAAESLRARDDALKAALNRQVGGGRDPEAFETLHRLCHEAGFEAESRAWLEQAISVDPTRSDRQARLAALPPAPPERPAGPRLSAKRATDGTGPIAMPARVVAPAPFRLEDRAEAAGLVYRYDPHAKGDLFIGDTMGGGVGLIDFDGDGWLDVYFVGGCPLPVDPAKVPGPNRLFRDKRDGTYEDVTDRAGVGGKGYGMGCAVGDYDGDGHDDLFVTGLGRTVLYRNKGDGTFEDVTDRAGVGSDRWTTAAGFADLDGDGDLDLVAVTYVAADPAKVTPCFDQLKRPIHCPPQMFAAQVDHLFRNDGGGRFTDVAKSAGLDLPEGDGLGLAIADFDGDGRLDLFVANDARPNFLFRNLGGLKFEEVGVSSGVALNGAGRATASMGVVADDLDGDGRIDLFHTDFNDEPNTFLRNLGRGQFEDATAASGLAAPSLANTGFGTAAVDLDNDGRNDLFVANGHVDDQPWFNIPMVQLAEVYNGKGNGRFALAPASAGRYFTVPRVGRGVAAGDLDNDGRVDLIVVHRDSPAVLLRNTTEGAGGWIGVKLVGTKSGRTPVGARVDCRAGGRSQTRWRTSGTSYLGQHDDRIRFGLGKAEGVESLRVTWPSGLVQEFKGLAAGRDYRVEEGREPLPVETRR